MFFLIPHHFLLILSVFCLYLDARSIEASTLEEKLKPDKMKMQRILRQTSLTDCRTEHVDSIKASQHHDD